MLRRICSFSHDAKEAFKASVIFLLVPGVSGGTCAGISATEGRRASLVACVAGARAVRRAPAGKVPTRPHLGACGKRRRLSAGLGRNCQPIEPAAQLTLRRLHLQWLGFGAIISSAGAHCGLNARDYAETGASAALRATHSRAVGLRCGNFYLVWLLGLFSGGWIRWIQTC